MSDQPQFEIRFTYDHYTHPSGHWTAIAYVEPDGYFASGVGDTQFDALHDLAENLTRMYYYNVSTPPSHQAVIEQVAQLVVGTDEMSQEARELFARSMLEVMTKLGWSPPSNQSTTPSTNTGDDDGT